MISCIIFMDWGSWVLAEVCGNAFSSEVPRGGNTVEAGTAPVRRVRLLRKLALPTGVL